MAQMADVAVRMCGKCENLIILMASSKKTLSPNDVKKNCKRNLFSLIVCSEFCYLWPWQTSLANILVK
jgi:hypothetical protein